MRQLSGSWRSEAAELALNQPREGRRGTVLEKRADRLHTDRQSIVGAADRKGRGWQPGEGGDRRPGQLVIIGAWLAVDIDAARTLAVIVRKGRHREGGAHHHIPVAEEV